MMSTSAVPQEMDVSLLLEAPGFEQQFGLIKHSTDRRLIKATARVESLPNCTIITMYSKRHAKCGTASLSSICRTVYRTWGEFVLMYQPIMCQFYRLNTRSETRNQFLKRMLDLDLAELLTLLPSEEHVPIYLIPLTESSVINYTLLTIKWFPLQHQSSYQTRKYPLKLYVLVVLKCIAQTLSPT